MFFWILRPWRRGDVANPGLFGVAAEGLVEAGVGRAMILCIWGDAAADPEPHPAIEVGAGIAQRTNKGIYWYLPLPILRSNDDDVPEAAIPDPRGAAGPPEPLDRNPVHCGLLHLMHDDLRMPAIVQAGVCVAYY